MYSLPLKKICTFFEYLDHLFEPPYHPLNLGEVINRGGLLAAPCIQGLGGLYALQYGASLHEALTAKDSEESNAEVEEIIGLNHELIRIFRQVQDLDYRDPAAYLSKKGVTIFGDPEGEKSQSELRRRKDQYDIWCVQFQTQLKALQEKYAAFKKSQAVSLATSIAMDQFKIKPSADDADIKVRINAWSTKPVSLTEISATPIISAGAPAADAVTSITQFCQEVNELAAVKDFTSGEALAEKLFSSISSRVR